VNKFFNIQSESIDAICEAYGETLEELIESMEVLVIIENNQYYNLRNIRALIKYRTYQLYRKHCE